MLLNAKTIPNISAKSVVQAGAKWVRVLLLEDNESDSVLIRSELQDALDLVEVAVASRLSQGIELARERLFDMVLLDLNLPDSTGQDTFRAFRKAIPNLPVIVLTGLRDENTARELLGIGAQDYLVKGADLTLLLARSIVNAIERHRLAAQLELANKELESFCHAISHDLRAPLRSIAGFTEILSQEHGQNLDEDGRDSLDRILRSTARMSAMIDDLLTLSRATSAEFAVKITDLSMLARQVVENLQDANPERQVEVNIDDNITVHGDPGLLLNVLENLLGNAWKFTSKTSRARIEVGSIFDNAGQPIFYVRDNGAGFDMQHAGRLFRTFHRLHTQDDFPGTGVGLVTVQRIIHRHGGRIWAEAAPNKGATFFFTLENGR